MHAPIVPAAPIVPHPFAAFGATLLKNMDRSRQARGKLLDRAGYGPKETPFTVLHSEPGLNLRRYEPEHTEGAALLLVPAPIKRSYIWDLAPEVSVVRRWLARGYRVYLAEWTPVEDDGEDFGLDDYGDRLLAACQGAIAADSGAGRVIVAGHSLGGILAAIYSCLHPERVRATILLESPLHFEEGSCCFRPLVRAFPHAGPLAAAFGRVPGVFLNLMSAMAEPQAFQWERMTDRYLSLGNPHAIATHMRVERWTYDEFALPGRLFTDIVESLYREDAFMGGRLDIGGRRIGPASLTAPLASVVDPRSRVIPWDAVVPFHEAAASAHKLLLRYGGDIGVNLQHVGVLVGASAHARIWPAIFDWLDELQTDSAGGG
ncbi:alpha/beta fold hydrolase [uncultured Massilia sp.]|uniref:alpha/beta fold hydrolase n=1 Tax=uncultured Massilia sp. TaxID=169973 RepID=UPI00258E80FD|nr:alpha/beta fold hydrolase [uncultured Massilia sp.]